MTLTPKQSRFVEEYAVDHNGAAAAVRAGYSPRTARQIAYENLMRPDIQAAVEAKHREVENRLRVTRERVLQELQAAIELARVKGDPMAMISGWREIAKMCGYYEPERRKIELSVEGAALRQRIQALSDAELLQLADGSGQSALTERADR